MKKAWSIFIFIFGALMTAGYFGITICEILDLSSNAVVTVATVVGKAEFKSEGNPGRKRYFYEHRIEYDGHRNILKNPDEISLGSQYRVQYSKKNPNTYEGKRPMKA